MPSFGKQASEAIRQAGGRMTGQRQLIIELLEDAHERLDAEALYQLARERDADISLATVYRTLAVLEAAGLVQPRYRSLEHERKYYEPINVEERYHFTCRHCHRVIPFKSAVVQELKHRLAAELQLDVLGACVCLDGLCPACQREAQRA